MWLVVAAALLSEGLVIDPQGIHLLALQPLSVYPLPLMFSSRFNAHWHDMQGIL